MENEWSKVTTFLETLAMGGCRSKIRVFDFEELWTAIGTKRRPNLGGSLWHTYFLWIIPVCEGMSTEVVGKKRVIFEV